MSREQTITDLQRSSPLVTQVTFTNDMGYEFSAVVPSGVIYPIPGMLLSYSGGEWPPNLWEYKTDEEYEELLKIFLLDETWDVTLWEDLNDAELEELLEEISSQDQNEEEITL